MDLRYALRSLWKNPGFSILAVLVMGLGIGANTAVFSVVNSVLLRPLAYRDPSRIVTVWSYWRNTGSRGQVSAPDFHDWHDQSTSFSAMASYVARGAGAVSIGPTAEYARLASVSPEFLDVFGVQPALGRFFSSEETKPGSGGAVVVSHAFWVSHFGKPALTNEAVRMLDRTLPVVGVLPPGFNFPNQTDIWFPGNTIFADTTSRSAHNYLVVGRLKPSVALAEGQAEMSAIGARLEQAYPPSNQNKNVAVAEMRDSMVGDVRTTLYLLLGAVTLVLLIACANVANLLLAKATARTREIAIRAAVGASRGRIVRQLVTESAVLASASGCVGLLIALWGSSVLVALAPSNVPRLEETSIDGAVLGFTFLVSVVASLLFGLAPALEVSRVDLNDALKRGATRSMGGGAGRMRNVLVVAEIALSVVLLSGAGLLIRSFSALNHVPLGFRPENVLVMGTSVPASDMASARRAMRFYEDLLPQAAAIPGVVAVGATRTPPGTISSSGGYYIDHLPGEAGRSVTSPQAVFSVVTPGAFAALGIPLKAGRDFNQRDAFEAPFTAVINDALARKAFPGQDPIGRLIFCGFDTPDPMKIVGIVGDIRQAGPASAPRPEIYMPFEQHPRPSTNLRLVVRTTSEPTAVADALRRKASGISVDVPVKFTTMETSLAENVAAPRFRTLLVGIFGVLAVCLAMAGVYGVMAYIVGQRVNEIGLRMALGAGPSDVLGLILRQGVILAGIGLALGLAGALAATQLLSKMLFGVKPTDPVTYVAVTALMAIVAVAASLFPALRAAHVDPLVALRQE